MPDGPPALDRLPTFDAAGDLNVVIETPKGSRNKTATSPGTARSS